MNTNYLDRLLADASKSLDHADDVEELKAANQELLYFLQELYSAVKSMDRDLDKVCEDGRK